ncbi:MAG: hypothetical protein JW700_00665 [Candidatus Aenigmarchaeota archaeon]|nr:hypothetical protein [Candidatus Aenigmarchaeota archaeon]
MITEKIDCFMEPFVNKLPPIDDVYSAIPQWNMAQRENSIVMASKETNIMMNISPQGTRVACIDQKNQNGKNMKEIRDAILAVAGISGSRKEAENKLEKCASDNKISYNKYPACLAGVYISDIIKEFEMSEDTSPLAFLDYNNENLSFLITKNNEAKTKAIYTGPFDKLLFEKYAQINELLDFSGTLKAGSSSMYT